MSFRSSLVAILLSALLGFSACAVLLKADPAPAFDLKDTNGKSIQLMDYTRGRVLVATQPTPAPDWTLTDVSGKTVKLADFKGKVVVLNFWATWCSPCVAELPDFIALRKKFSEKDVAIVGISLDSLQPSAVASFAKKSGINYPIVMSTDDTNAKYGADFGIPMTYLIDRSGRIIAINPSLINAADAEKRINQLIAAPATP